MPTIDETVEVGVPVHAAYDQWTRFEEFPRFMEGVREVQRVDDTHVRWIADETGGGDGWDAEITAMEAGRRIAWHALDGRGSDGVVQFEPLGEDATRVRLLIDRAAAGDDDGRAQRRLRRDLERFKDWMESRDDLSGGAGDDAATGAEGARLPSLSRLRGMIVVNREDEKVGKVREVYLDAAADHVRYLGVSTGWLSRGIHLVPVDDVTYIDDGTEAYVVVPYTVEHLRGAPSLGDDDELTPAREREIQRHYERVDDWDAARDAVRARQSTPAPTPQIAEAEVADAVARRWEG